MIGHNIGHFIGIWYKGGGVAFQALADTEGEGGAFEGRGGGGRYPFRSY